MDNALNEKLDLSALHLGIISVGALLGAVVTLVVCILAVRIITVLLRRVLGKTTLEQRVSKYIVSTVRFDSYLSERSILGAGIILDRTRYDATQGDSFHTSQWLGVLHYRYAIPLGRFIVSPTGGVLLGGEQCDQRSRQGNILPYGNQFVYGLMLQCDVEYVLGRHWAIALEPRMTYLIKTQFDNVKMMANIGLKYYF